MKVGIVGASGYVGGEVLRLLVSHPKVEVSMVTSRQYVGDYIHRTHPSLKGFTDLTYSELDYDKMSDIEFREYILEFEDEGLEDNLYDELVNNITAQTT